MAKRVLITGSEGFTGRYVCQEFQSAGWEVWGAGVTSISDRDHYLTIDLLKPETLKPIADVVKPDVVVHLAASAFVAEHDATIFYHTNLLGTRNLLEALCQSLSPPDCTILASSANVYGNSDLEVLSEESPTHPANDYAVSKLAMEYLAKTYYDRLPIIITRPFNYTGVGQSERFLIPKIVNHFKRRAEIIELGNLDVAREFSDVRDVVKIYHLLAECKPVGETINLCSGAPIALWDCLHMAMELSSHDIEIKVNPAFVRDNEIKRLSGDRRKLESLIATPKPRPFKETLAWMLENFH
jgi:nucleoside-diphosphate-sugar epimerase